MTTPTTRRWFQFHLATALVVMIAAGITVALQFRKTDRVLSELHASDMPWLITREMSLERGFPWTCWASYHRESETDSEVFPGEFDIKFVLLDAAFTAALLIGIAFASEAIIRRRSRASANTP